jgi:alpha,alpha-trehalase
MPRAYELDQATAIFERAAAINDADLPAEEVDETSGEMIGNFPQAFSHIGLINARLGHQPGPRNTCLR